MPSSWTVASKGGGFHGDLPGLEGDREGEEEDRLDQWGFHEC